jgi:hypothetical protein
MDLAQLQVQCNAEAVDSWQLYSQHRSRVVALLLDTQRSGAGRLCILGAGNLNDVDLVTLLTTFREVVLIDVDRQAVERGVSQQGLTDDHRIRIIAPCDLSTVYEELSLVRLGRPDREELLGTCMSKLERTLDLGLASFDVVCSAGLLTQIIDSAGYAVGESDPMYWPLVSALRRQHLLLLLELTRPGGAAVLITEIVSSDTCPKLSSVSDVQLARLLQQEIAAHNFFTGTNPAAIGRLLRTDGRISRLLTDALLSSPWLWSFKTRTYATYGITMRRRGEALIRRPPVRPSYPPPLPPRQKANDLGG